MSFPAYPTYKDSEVPWLGEVPNHWNISRMKDLFEIRKRIAGELGHDVLSITQSGLRVKDIESNEGQQAMDYSKYQLVHPGDFAMNHMDLLTGWIDIACQSGVTSPDYRVFATRDPGSIDDRFFLRAFQMAYTARQFYPFGQGSSQLGRWRLPTDAFNAFPLPVPPATEQASISTFLNRETAKIDALVAEQERLIALLKEKRQAVISHAVTKGLNPDAPMKDSGIEWLGEIPAHWEVGPVKRYFEFLDSKRIPLSTEERGGMQGDYPYYGASGIIDYVNDYIFDEPLVLVSEDGANLLMRNYRIAFVAVGQYWVNNHAHILKPLDNLTAFWADRLESIDLTPIVTGSAQPKLTADALANLRLAVPPEMAERAEIEAHVANATAQFAPLMKEAESAITLLQERRAALISAAVTGKIDVRNAATISNVIPIARAQGQRDWPSLRAVVGAYAIRDLGAMGRMAVMKAGYLAQAHAGLSDLNGRFERNAAGPYDQNLIAAMERGAAELCSIRTIKPSGANLAVTYTVPNAVQAPSDALEALAGADKAKSFLSMLALLKGIGREGVEGVATIYAVWNDLIAAGKTASDDAVCSGVLHDWHDEKRERFDRTKLDHWLGWMRRNGFVPDGTAPRTDHQGNLFA